MLATLGHILSEGRNKMYYIFNENKKIVATSNFPPNSADLKTRKEFAIQSDEEIPFREVCLDKNNKVVRLTKI
jgi:hypothetical protein